MKPGNPPLSAALAGAVDLSGLKARATAPPPASADGGGGGDGGGAYVIEVSEASFQTEVLERSMQVPVVLDLWAEWCGPCKQLSPVLEKLAAEGDGAWVLAKVDVDANPQLAQALRVQGIPAVKAVFQGQLVAEFTGAVPEPQVRQWIGALIEAVSGVAQNGGPGGEEQAPPEDPRLDAAEAAVERGDLAEAARRYNEILAAEPGHELAQLALRQVELIRRTEGLPPSTLTDADAKPDDVALQLSASDMELFNGNPEAAFARLIATVRRSSGADRDNARARLLDLFAIVGDADPMVAKARRDLASVLF
jgi:putative thioredoxin